ncbi:SBBP repeat-containing protein, partial [bacterium]|nr:SBBP repeat-containing protein [bacterium]
MRKWYLQSGSLFVFLTVLFALEGSPAECRHERCVRDSQSGSRKHSVARGAVSQEAIRTAYGKTPLSFELNRGQTDAEVRFLSRGNGYTLFLTRTEAVLALRNRQNMKHAEETTTAERITVSTRVLRMHLLGTNGTPRMEGLDILSGKSHYFTGSDPKQWRTNISHYARVRCAEVYPGIDLIYYGNEGRLEYDFVVSPGADPTAIRLGFKGVERLNLDDEGNLILPMGGGQVIQHAPIIFQEVNGQRRSVSGGYLLKRNKEVAFQVASYDRTRPLVIDPIRGYSTYLGGSVMDVGSAIAVDRWGNAYVTGYTWSTDFPKEGSLQTHKSEEDVFVTKLNRYGSGLIYSTFLGGDDVDRAQGIVLDSGGNAYVTGYTKSTDFPREGPFQALNGGKEDAFVARLSADGSSLIYSTYLGGLENDRGSAITVDASGCAYVTGYTLSDKFPVAPWICSPRMDCPYQTAKGARADVFVTKFDAQGGDLVYSTYLGGDNQDTADAIALDDSGRAIVAGTTLSTDFPTENPIQASSAGGIDDGFVTKLDDRGHALIFSTYLGGSDRDS